MPSTACLIPTGPRRSAAPEIPGGDACSGAVKTDEETAAADKGLPGLSAPVQLAQEVAAGLGPGEILLGTLPPVPRQPDLSFGPDDLDRSRFGGAAAGAPQQGHQFSLLHIELPLLVHHPFVVPATTQGIAPVLFFQGGLLEREDIGHGLSMRVRRDSYNDRAPGRLRFHGSSCVATRS